MHVHRITTLDAPGLQPYRTLRKPAEQFEAGRFVAEGSRVVTRLLASDHAVRSMLLTEEWLDRLRTEIESQPTGPTVFVAPKDVLEGIVGFHLHQGIMAVADIPAQPTVQDLLPRRPGRTLLVAIDDLLNAENVGIIVRNARAFGANGVLVGETSSSPYLRRAVRNSLGTVFTIPVLHATDLATTLRHMRDDHSVAVYGAETKQGGASLDSVDLTSDVCLVVGSEDTGIRKHILKECTQTVEIPMTQGIDSLNVANAVAVLLYEAQRQRRASG